MSAIVLFLYYASYVMRLTYQISPIINYCRQYQQYPIRIFEVFPFLSHLIDNLWSISRQQSDKTYDLCLCELILYENNSLPLFKNTHIFTVLTQNGKTSNRLTLKWLKLQSCRLSLAVWPTQHLQSVKSSCVGRKLENHVVERLSSILFYNWSRQ